MAELQENGNKAPDPGMQRLHSLLQSSHRAGLKDRIWRRGQNPGGPGKETSSSPGGTQGPQMETRSQRYQLGAGIRACVCEASVLRENRRLETDLSGMC